MSYMPTTEQLLSSLKELANTWRPLAVFWHLFFMVFIIALIAGVRPSKRVSSIFLTLPLLSVSILAWSSLNPFNGVVFALIGILLLLVSIRLPHENIHIASSWAMLSGIFMFILGWIYPCFLDVSSSLSFLYSAPTGIIPCPTLSIGIGLTLILNSFGSRKLSLILGISGVIYGIMGIAQLGVAIDLFLLLGSVAVLIFAFQGIKVHGRKPLGASIESKAKHLGKS